MIRFLYILESYRLQRDVYHLSFHDCFCRTINLYNRFGKGLITLLRGYKLLPLGFQFAAQVKHSVLVWGEQWSSSAASRFFNLDHAAGRSKTPSQSNDCIVIAELSVLTYGHRVAKCILFELICMGDNFHLSDGKLYTCWYRMLYFLS